MLGLCVYMGGSAVSAFMRCCQSVRTLLMQRILQYDHSMRYRSYFVGTHDDWERVGQGEMNALRALEAVAHVPSVNVEDSI